MAENIETPGTTDQSQGVQTSAGGNAASKISSMLKGLQNFNVADFVKGKPGQWQKMAVVAVVVIIVMGLGAVMMWGLALWALANSFGDPSGSRCATGEECFLKDSVFSNTTTITNADWVLERIKPHKPKKERIQQIIDESRKAGINPAILISFWAGEQTFGNEEKAFGCGHYKEGGDDRGFDNQLRCAIPTIKDAMNNTGQYTDPEGENIWTRLIYNYVAAARKKLYDEEGYVTGSGESRIAILKKLEPSKGSWVECAENTQCNITGGCQIEGPDIKQAVRHEKRTFTVTAYCPPATGYDRIEGGQTTASGINVGIGAVAVPPFSRPNPNINGDTPDYPWGTTFVIPGYGTGVALDHGCAIQKAGVADSCKSSNWPKTKNDHIDLFVGNGKDACANWERNNPSTLDVDVYWFDQSTSSQYYYKKVNSFIKRTCTGLPYGSSIAGPCGQKILDIAKQEVGYKTNNGDCNKYSNSCLAWCAAFTSWVYKQAGYFPKIEPWTIGLRDNYRNNLYVVRVDGDISKMRPGDIFWQSAPKNDSKWHVGIIESISGNTLNTIEGNVKGDVVARRKKTGDILRLIKYVARPKGCN